MDLILWRHAEAEEAPPGSDDLSRVLTPRGEKQAARMAAWLDQHLPAGARVVCSPAVRCERTVLPLGRKYKLRAELAPGSTPADLLAAVQWPESKQTVVVVGHQPVLGQTIAQLLAMEDAACSVRKGAIWWLRTRQRDGKAQTVVVAVQSPDSV